MPRGTSPTAVTCAQPSSCSGTTGQFAGIVRHSSFFVVLRRIRSHDAAVTPHTPSFKRGVTTVQLLRTLPALLGHVCSMTVDKGRCNRPRTDRRLLLYYRRVQCGLPRGSLRRTRPSASVVVSFRERDDGPVGFRDESDRTVAGEKLEDSSAAAGTEHDGAEADVDGDVDHHLNNVVDRLDDVATVRGS